MAGVDNRTLCVALIALVLAFVGGSSGGLMLTMDLKKDNNFCGHLNCWNTGTSDRFILAITSISLYDIRQPAVRIQLATVKSDGTGIKINQSKTSEVVGAGCINRYNADLSVNLMNQQDCQSGSFLCELEYIDTDGHSDTMIAHSISVNSSGPCDCGELTSQQSLLARQLNTLRQNYTVELTVLRHNYTVELAALKQQNSRLLTQFQLMSEELKLIRNLTSRVSNQTSPSTATDHQTDQARQTHSTFNCTRGITHISTRVKFLLWGQIPALCDTQSDGGGWVIIQRRTKGDVDFYKNWQNYKTGFGTPDTDFWLGNEIIHNLTSRGYNELRMDITYNNVQHYAQYNVFSVDNEQQNYRLSVSGYKGTSGDGMAEHNYMMFSTYDRDNDRYSINCAIDCKGAWWYNACFASNLNGAWGVTNHTGVKFNPLGGTLTYTELKVRLGNI